LKFALGTAQFGLNYGIANQQGQTSRDEAKAILDFAWARGMDTLDTAIAYGQSEQRLGEIGIENWQVVSKLPAVPEDCHDITNWVADAVNKSRQRLKVRSLYGLLLHRPQQLLEKEGARLDRALQQLKQDGVVQKIGISIYAPSELDALCSRYRFDVVQSPFNLIDRRLIDTGWLSRLADLGTELHVRSVFLQGLLLFQPADRPQKFTRWSELWAKWDTWLKEVKLTPLEACICFVLSFQDISKVIIGVDSLSQLREILEAAERPMPRIPDELKSSDQDLLNPSRWHLMMQQPKKACT
jgi:aryl-alcohol dehydrogenase-like predicted oxidoreductase